MTFYTRLFLLSSIATSCCCANALARKWTDPSGQFSTEAEFVEIKNDEVVLKKADGSVIKVDLKKLSAADRDFIAKITDPAKTANDSVKGKIVGKWMMSSGLLDFKENGELILLGEKRNWRLDGDKMIWTINGNDVTRLFVVSDDKLTMTNAGSEIRATRLNAAKFGTKGKWQLKDLAGKWSAGKSLELTLDASGKGMTSSEIQVGKTGGVQVEIGSAEVSNVDDVHVLKFQGMFWLIYLTEDRKSVEVVCADEKAVTPNKLVAKKQ